MTFNSEGCTLLEVLPNGVAAQSTLTLRCKTGSKTQNAFCSLVTFSLEQNEEYELVYEACSEGFVYIYNPLTVVSVGIKVLSRQGNSESNPYIENYHFTPPTGWLNDPNGLCFHGGVFHMYYQFYPHAQQWGNMHWGHAVSEDLMLWRHMPVFLTPQQALLENTALAGGAFSGSAVLQDKGIRFFLTRHSALRENESEMIETQTTLFSEDGTKPSEETIIIENTKEEHLHHFRDPKVFTHNNIHYLVLGSAINNKAAILLYSSTDYITWHYISAVLQINNEQCVTVECPDMFELDGKFVCVAAQMCVVDNCKRKSPVYWYIGDFDKATFIEQASGLYDFGANFYAVQSFEHKGRRIAFGWINDFYNEHVEHEGGVCGSMSLPRELHVKNKKLYQSPAREVYSLLGARLCSSTGQSVRLDIKYNRYYAEILVNSGASFEVIVAKNGANKLVLACQNGEISINTAQAEGGMKLIAQCSALTKLEIFADARAFEFFINDGEAVGAKTFYSDKMQGYFEFNGDGKAQSINVYEMKSTRGGN